jgi:LysR family transcriptional repressor of citA
MPKFLPIFFEAAPNIDISISVLDSNISETIEENNYHIGIDRKLPNTDKVNYANVCEGKIKLIVPNVNENKYLISEVDFFKKYRILSENHPSYWINLVEKIREIVPEADFTNISSVNVTESLIKADQGISYLPIYIFKDSVNKDIRIIESKLIEDPISFTYVIWKKEAPEIELFLELFTRFVKEEQSKIWI